MALVRRGEGASVIGHVLGFGASSDAVHVTAPDRTGAGLSRAAHAALEDAALDGSAIDLVSAHGTATPFNDAAEAKALYSASAAQSGEWSYTRSRRSSVIRWAPPARSRLLSALAAIDATCCRPQRAAGQSIRPWRAACSSAMPAERRSIA